MDKKSATDFSFLAQKCEENAYQNVVFLAQSDTTAGFLSKDSLAINKKKGAKHAKPLLKEVASLSAIPHRVPTFARTQVRHAKKTSFILPNGTSFRVVKEGLHSNFLRGFKWLYSSSANPTNKPFCKDFALLESDIIVLDRRGIFADKSSTIIKLGRMNRKKIR